MLTWLLKGKAELVSLVMSETSQVGREAETQGGWEGRHERSSS